MAGEKTVRLNMKIVLRIIFHIACAVHAIQRTGTVNGAFIALGKKDQPTENKGNNHIYIK